MLSQLLLFVFIIFVVMIIVAAVLLRSLYYRTGLNKIVDLLRGQTNGQQRSQRRSAYQGQHRPRPTETPDGNVIIDRRNPEKANQKIFDKDEGEYVDYKEE